MPPPRPHDRAKATGPLTYPQFQLEMNGVSAPIRGRSMNLKNIEYRPAHWPIPNRQHRSDSVLRALRHGKYEYALALLTHYKVFYSYCHLLATKMYQCVFSRIVLTGILIFRIRFKYSVGSVALDWTRWKMLWWFGLWSTKNIDLWFVAVGLWCRFGFTAYTFRNKNIFGAYPRTPIITFVSSLQLIV